MKWPTDYQNWSGTIDDLVTTANRILEETNPQSSALTLRTARHYQQVGVLGRGTRNGRVAHFGYEDLVKLVSAKTMVGHGMKLYQASDVLKSTPPETLAQDLNPEAARAVGVVAALREETGWPLLAQGYLSNSPLSPPARSLSRSLLSGASVPPAAFSSSSLNQTSTYHPSPELTRSSPFGLPHVQREITPWLGVHYDPECLEKASAQERLEAIQGLNQMIDELSKNTTGESNHD